MLLCLMSHLPDVAINCRVNHQQATTSQHSCDSIRNDGVLLLSPLFYIPDKMLCRSRQLNIDSSPIFAAVKDVKIAKQHWNRRISLRQRQRKPLAMTMDASGGCLPLIWRPSETWFRGVVPSESELLVWVRENHIFVDGSEQKIPFCQYITTIYLLYLKIIHIGKI
jgi:hypothetical protein